MRRGGDGAQQPQVGRQGRAHEVKYVLHRISYVLVAGQA